MLSCSKPLIILVGRSEKVVFPDPASVVLPAETCTATNKGHSKVVSLDPVMTVSPS